MKEQTALLLLFSKEHTTAEFASMLHDLPWSMKIEAVLRSPKRWFPLFGYAVAKLVGR